MRILVGLSGGIDSAVAAYLLKEQGFDVEACFMRNWDSALNNDTLGNPTLDDEICPQESDYLDAKKVADALGIKLWRHDYIKEYWDSVFKDFIAEYARGRTPNPDILCNKYIKFDAFLGLARDLGFDMIATGHYVKKVDLDGKAVLAKATDRNKDQSYFLAQISPEAIAKSIFPLGDITKPEVRDIGHRLDLAIADKKDSTGICFIGERDFRDFLKNYIPMQEGDIIDIDTKEVIGRHQGVYYYTIGQRKGLGVGGPKGPFYCVGKDVYKNELYVVDQKDEYWAYSDSCLVTGFNSQVGDINSFDDYHAKFRYRQKDIPVKVEILGEDKLLLHYEPIKATTPGQQAVLYAGDIMVGGGTIDVVYRDGEDKEEILRKWLSR